MVAANKITRLKLPGVSQIVPILTILMEVFWSYTVLIWVSQWTNLKWTGTPLNLISCFALTVFVEILARTSLASRWPSLKVQLVVIPCSLLLLIILIRLNNGGGYALWNAGWFSYAQSHLSAIITGLIFGIYLTWRGISVGRSDNSFERYLPPVPGRVGWGGGAAGRLGYFPGR